MSLAKIMAGGSLEKHLAGGDGTWFATLLQGQFSVSWDVTAEGAHHVRDEEGLQGAAREGSGIPA
jgi:hypothetical protein